MARLDAKALEKLLVKECQVYEQYLAALELEREHVIKSAADQVLSLSEQREQLTDQLVVLKQQRVEFVKALGLDEKTPLSVVIAEQSQPADRRRLMPLAQKLKQLVGKVRTQAKEFSQLVNFSLSMVDSSISLLWAGTQNVTKSYGADAVMRQSYTPKRSRRDLVLKEA